MRKRVFPLLFTLPLLAAGGCSLWLPSGTPPAGTIVEPEPPPQELTARGAENLLVTSLGAYLLTENAVCVWRVHCPPELEEIARNVFRRLRAFAPVTVDPESETVFRGLWEEDGRAAFELRRGGHLLWNEAFLLAPRAEDAPVKTAVP